jgi:hypothetical protein
MRSKDIAALSILKRSFMKTKVSNKKSRASEIKAIIMLAL